MDFLISYTSLLEKEVNAILQLINGSVESMMSSVNDLSSDVERNRKAADETLEQTYFKPDDQTKEVVNSLQDSVEAVFEKAMANANNSSQHRQETSSDINEKMKLVEKHFSKHISALDQLDKRVQEILYRIIAALSSDDVISQRMEHCVFSLQLLEKTLNSNNSLNLQDLKEELTSAIYKKYTSEDEKALFHEVFG
jgi:phage-related protein